MQGTTTTLAATAIALGWSACADAQPLRCDCTSIVDTCSADVEARGSWLEIKTDKPQCARVDYFVDGQPFVSLVVDGEDRQNWLARTENPRIMVQSCQVCRDNGAGAAPSAAATAPAAASAAEDAGEDAKLEPLIAGVPAYPETARARGIEGNVDVELTVDAQGNVTDARVVSATPKSVFDAAALAAVRRWRYPAAEDRAPQTVTERVEFRLEDLPPAPAAARSAGPLNQCVREDGVYNYGEVVDVALINACREPLVVFGCAHGTGKYADRWLCSDSEEQGKVLVSADDRRVGERFLADTGNGSRTFSYAPSFSVTRAPNSQYWWIACAEDDATCRSDARIWARAVEGQPARIDPQNRSRLAVARSN